MSKKANHICKNINCTKGRDENGNPTRKHYYACDYCDRINNWKSIACSYECYEEYMQQILEARGKNVAVDLLPERTDKTKEEVQELMERPIEEIKEEVKEDLKDYFVEEEHNTIEEIVEVINAELDAEPIQEVTEIQAYSDEVKVNKPNKKRKK